MLITDWNSFINWLKTRPESMQLREAAALSWRIAARTLSLTLDKDSMITTNPSMTAVSFRQLAIARVMTHLVGGSNWQSLSLSANSAYVAGRSVDSATYGSSRFAARSARFALSAARSAYSALAVDSVAQSAETAAVAADDFGARYGVWAAISRDCEIVANQNWERLLLQPLWPKDLKVTTFWQLKKSEYNFIDHLRNLPNSHVWLRWYDRVQSGTLASEEIELLYADPALDELWEKENGFELVTAWIAERLPQSELPPQGSGTHMGPTDGGEIGHADAVDIDSAGNNIKRINQLRPLALKCVSELKAHLSSNLHPELIAATDQYFAALTGLDNRVDWGTVWGLGMMLESRAKAADRQIADRLLPELEDPAKAALDSLLKIHGPLVLSTQDGQDLFEDEKKYRLPAKELKAMYTAIEDLIVRLTNAPKILREDAKATFESMASTPLDEDKPERTASYISGTTKNAVIVLVAGAVAASPTIVSALVYGAHPVVAITGAATVGGSLLFSEAIKKSKPFAALQATLTTGLDTLHDINLSEWSKKQAIRFAPFRRFVIDNEAALLAVADREKLEWLQDYIALIIRYKDSD
jgi:hypothetical protein